MTSNALNELDKKKYLKVILNSDTTVFWDYLADFSKWQQQRNERTYSVVCQSKSRHSY